VIANTEKADETHMHDEWHASTVQRHAAMLHVACVLHLQPSLLRTAFPQHTLIGMAFVAREHLQAHPYGQRPGGVHLPARECAGVPEPEPGPSHPPSTRASQLPPQPQQPLVFPKAWPPHAHFLLHLLLGCCCCCCRRPLRSSPCMSGMLPMCLAVDVAQQHVVRGQQPSTSPMKHVTPFTAQASDPHARHSQDVALELQSMPHLQRCSPGWSSHQHRRRGYWCHRRTSVTTQYCSTAAWLSPIHHPHTLAAAGSPAIARPGE
jgi:hypothetical protein